LVVAYDALEESVALIEGRRVEPVRRLTRRRRFAAMAVDISGDAAVTMFARRGVGCVWQEIHVLGRRNGQWEWLGSGGGTAAEHDLLADRPMVLPSFLRPGGTLAVSGSGSTLDDGDGVSRDGEWINYADVRVSAQVTSVQVEDRLLGVPWHGHVLVVWRTGERPSRVVALDEGGISLGEALLPIGH
jgi:hypothetical protein